MKKLIELVEWFYKPKLRTYTATGYVEDLLTHTYKPINSYTDEDECKAEAKRIMGKKLPASAIIVDAIMCYNLDLFMWELTVLVDEKLTGFHYWKMKHSYWKKSLRYKLRRFLLWMRHFITL